MRLYHLAPFQRAVMILAGGFSDEKHPFLAGSEDGVWLTERPGEAEPDWPLQIDLAVPEPEIARWWAGIEAGKGRAWLIPAYIVNTRGTTKLWGEVNRGP